MWTLLRKFFLNRVSEIAAAEETGTKSTSTAAAEETVTKSTSTVTSIPDSALTLGDWVRVCTIAYSIKASNLVEISRRKTQPILQAMNRVVEQLHCSSDTNSDTPLSFLRALQREHRIHSLGPVLARDFLKNHQTLNNKVIIKELREKSCREWKNLKSMNDMVSAPYSKNVCCFVGFWENSEKRLDLERKFEPFHDTTTKSSESTTTTADHDRSPHVELQACAYIKQVLLLDNTEPFPQKLRVRLWVEHVPCLDCLIAIARVGRQISSLKIGGFEVGWRDMWTELNHPRADSSSGPV